MEDCSIPEYLNPGQGFEAKMKLVPGHFIVDELSSFDGEVLPATTGLPTSDGNTNAIMKRRAETETDNCSSEKRPRTSITTTNDSCQDLIGSCWDDVDRCRQQLAEILGSETYVTLNNFAQKVKTDAEKSSLMTPIEIGAFSKRDVRTFVHRSIRLIHPYLKTVTKPHTGEISVQCCPNYWKFAALLGHDMSSKIFKFIHIEVLENTKKQINVEGPYTKDERRQIHQLIASCYGKFLEARTFTSFKEDTNRVITIQRKPYLDKTRQSDYEDAGVITAFTLWKKNTETYAAIYYLGRHMNILQNMFNFAGIKDKRAITTQKCTVTGISPDNVEAACKTLPKFLKVSDCRRVSRVVRLGELDGNQFRIKLTRIRNLQQETEDSSLVQDIHSAVENVKLTGFINYFGPQRFGRTVLQKAGDDKLLLTLEAPAVGLAMLRKNFKKAVDILLSPTKNLSSDSDAAKKHFQETRNIDETLKMMPSQKLRELSILRTLKRIGTTNNDACIKAVLSLPHSARMLYVHSFSSYVWNEMATARIRKYGNNVVEGDLVGQPGQGTKLSQVKSVTAEDISLNRYSVKDVVLPVPGSQVCYPPCLEKEYRDILEKFSVDASRMYRIPALKISAAGAYRKLIQTPANLSLKILPHGDSLKAKLAEKKSRIECEDADSPVAMEKDDVTGDLQPTTNQSPGYENFDIGLAFDLPPSCYATTFLSELTKGHLK